MSRRHDIRVVRVRSTEADIVHDRAAEEVDVLKHHRDHGKEVDGTDIAHVASADPDVTILNIVKPRDQAEHGGFARTRPSDNGGQRARWDAA